MSDEPGYKTQTRMQLCGQIEEFGKPRTPKCLRCAQKKTVCRVWDTPNSKSKKWSNYMRDGQPCDFPDLANKPSLCNHKASPTAPVSIDVLVDIFEDPTIATLATPVALTKTNFAKGSKPRYNQSSEHAQWRPSEGWHHKADVKELFDILFKEQKATKLRVEELNEMLDTFLKDTGDLMTEMYVPPNDCQGMAPGRE